MFQPLRMRVVAVLRLCKDSELELEAACPTCISLQASLLQCQHDRGKTNGACLLSMLDARPAGQLGNLHEGCSCCPPLKKFQIAGLAGAGQVFQLAPFLLILIRNLSLDCAPGKPHRLHSPASTSRWYSYAFICICLLCDMASLRSLLQTEVSCPGQLVIWLP